MKKPHLITDKFTGSFSVNQSKLIRLCEVAQKRIGEGGVPTSVKVTMRQESGKEFHFDSLLELFKIDNPVKNKISKLSIQVNTPTNPNSIGIDFQDDSSSCIEYKIDGNSLDWSYETAAEIDEQIERFRTAQGVGKIMRKSVEALIAIICFALIIGFALALVAIPMSCQDSTKREAAIVRLTIKRSDAREILAAAQKANTPDEQNAVLVKALSATLDAAIGPEQKTLGQSLLGILGQARTWCFIIPAVVIFGAFIYLGAACYPVFIFAWGDWENEQVRIEKKRNGIWIGVVLAFVVGLLVNMFSFSLQ